MTSEQIKDLAETIEQLEDLKEYCKSYKSYIKDSDIWEEDTIALTKAIEILMRLGDEEVCRYDLLDEVYFAFRNEPDDVKANSIIAVYDNAINWILTGE